MATDAPFKPPKKKPNIFWWIGGAFVVLVLLFFLQLVGPSPRIVISPQTTYITAPLRADGLPDYNKYVLDLGRDGITPENNAATLLWPTYWPGELSPADCAIVAKELGLNSIPQSSDAITPIHYYIKQLINVQKMELEKPSAAGAPPADSSAEDVDHPEFNVEDRTDQLCDRVSSQPWKTAEFPQIAKWVHDNQNPLDQMVEASRRPRCYFPTPSLLKAQNQLLISILLPGPQGARESGRSLIVRAMWHVGEHRNTEAWRDLLAIHRLGRLVAQGPTLIEELVGIAIDGVGCRGTAQFLHESNLSPEEARQVLRDLDSLEPFAGMADSLDHMERSLFLDSALALSQNQANSQDWKDIGIGESFAYLRHLNIDWNVTLRKGNEYYDRYVAALRLPTYAARKQAITQVENDVDRAISRFGPHTIVSSILSPASRSDAVASMFIGLILPAANAALDAQDRANANFELLHIAAALTLFRAEHDKYPEKLSELVPSVLENAPVDLFNGKPFAYKRIGDGYLLYSLGLNGTDDGGSNDIYHVFQGQDLSDNPDDPLLAKIPTGADDLAIRVPTAPIRVPSIP